MSDAMAVGLQLTVLGMGLVFLLLALLWGLMVLMVRFDRPEPAASRPAPVTEPGPAIDPALRAAIAVAVLRYRSQGQAAPVEPAAGHWIEIGRARQQLPGRARRRG